jgi:hypothetical protein
MFEYRLGRQRRIERIVATEDPAAHAAFSRTELLSHDMQCPEPSIMVAGGLKFVSLTYVRRDEQ